MGTSHEQSVSEPFTLDPSNPIEATLITIAETHRKKNHDYAEDGSVFSNFEMTAELTNQLPEESALFNVAQKLVRLRNLKQNGRTTDPTNESVQDTYLDLAVYAVIACAIARQSAREVQAEQRQELFKGMAERINEAVRIDRGGAIQNRRVFEHTIHVNTTGQSAEQIADSMLRQLNGIDWTRRA